MKFFRYLLILLAVLPSYASAQEGVDEHKCGTFVKKDAYYWGYGKYSILKGIERDNKNNSIFFGQSYSGSYTVTRTDNEYDEIQDKYRACYFEKKDENGELIWSTLFAPYYNSYVRDLKVDDLGNSFVLGSMINVINPNSYDYYTNYVLRINSKGKRIKYDTIVSDEVLNPTMTGLVLASDKLIVLSGYSRTYGNEPRQAEFMRVINKQFNIQWDIIGKPVLGQKAYFIQSVYHNNYIYSTKSVDEEYFLGDSYKTGKKPYTLVEKFSLSGKLVWSKKLSPYGEYFFSKMIVDNDGNICIKFFTSDTNIVTTKKDEELIKGNTVLAKYDNDGNLLWSRHEKYNAYRTFSELKVDAQNNIYTTGNWYNTDAWMNEEFGDCNFVGEAKRAEGIYISKYSPNGTELNTIAWGKEKKKESESYWYHPYLYDFDLIGDHNYNLVIGYLGEDKRIRNDEYENSSTFFSVLEIKADKVGVSYTGDEFMCEGESFSTTLTANDEDIETREAEVWVEISDEFGSFASPISISNTITEYGEVLCNIPENLASGENYRIRTSSSDDKVDYGYASTRIKIKQLPNTEISGEENVCHGEIADYQISPSQDIAYSWEVSGGEIIGESDKETLKVEWNDQEDGFIILSQENTEYGCSNTIGFPVNIQKSIDFEYQEMIGICENGDELELNHILPSGGIYSGVGIENNTLNPSELESGTYSLTYTIVGQCTESSVFTYTIFAQPNSPTITLEGVTMSVDSDLDVFWYRLPDEENPVATGKSYVPTEKGDYAAKVSSQESCLSELSNIISPPLSISDNLKEFVSIKYDNDLLTIQAKEKRIFDEINIYDIQGKLVYSSGFKKELQIDISEFAVGNYILELKGKEILHHIFNK